MAISYLDYYLPETRLELDRLIADERSADPAAVRAAIRTAGEHVEGLPASQLFAIDSNAALFARYGDSARLESDIRHNWNIDNARVEQQRTALDILHGLLERMFATMPVAGDEIDHLIYCSYNQNMYRDEETCIPYVLQHRHGMSKCTTTMMFRDCASVMAAFEYAESLIACERARHCLVVCVNLVEKMPRLLEFTLVSDAVGIALLSRGGEIEVVDHASRSMGTAGGKLDQDILRLARAGTQVMRDLLDRNGLQPRDLDRIITNNTNAVTYREIYARLLDCAPERILCDNIAHGGHCGNVDMLRNLKDVIAADTSCHDILLYNTGGTHRYVHWNAVLLRNTHQRS